MSEAIVTLRGPYDVARSISFWRRSTGELCEHWADGVYRRIVVLDGNEIVLTLSSVGTVEQPAVTVALDDRPVTPEQLAAVAPMVRAILGDDLDLREFYQAVSDDPVFVPVIELLYGVRAPRSPLWETLCWVICGQQIGVPFAYLLKERLVQRYGVARTVAGRPLYRFPSPEIVAAADPSELQGMQFSRNKARFIIELAQALQAGRLDLEYVAQLPTEAAIEYLIAFRGIGRWTAEFTLLRALGRTDALPANDAGVRQGIAALYGQRLPEAELRAFAQRWGEWGGVVAMYLLGWLRERKT